MLFQRALQPFQRRPVLIFSRHAARRHASSLADLLANPDAKVHSFISRSRDPFLNLSIEHYLLQKSPHDSTILFLYTNRPCIVLGRNQNPWMEVNLGLLKAALESQGKETEPPAIGDIDLVRRRSGGGTVFHDEGNVNWSVISPPAEFTRDKHAEMVVRGLRKLGVERARVNERHDIVLDQGSQRVEMEGEDTHRTPFTVDDPAGPRPVKVSGSAYKLIRGRALHHATCLLSSPNLNIIPQYLHSPAKPYIKAQGVESVSSPVSNIGLTNRDFIARVQEEFGNMYGLTSAMNDATELGEEQLEVDEIRKGYEEMKTLEWTYLQTPKFTFSTFATEEDDRAKPELPPSLARSRVLLNVRNGVINSGRIAFGTSNEAVRDSSQRLEGRRLHEIDEWRPFIGGKGNSSEEDALTSWLERTLPSPLKR